MGSDTLKDGSRIATLVLGLVILILIGIGWGAAGWGMGHFFLSMVCIFFILSLIWFILLAVDVLSLGTDIVKKIDMIYHLVGGILILIPAIICLIWRLYNEIHYCIYPPYYNYPCFYWHVVVFLIATIVGIVDGVIYLLIAKSGFGK